MKPLLQNLAPSATSMIRADHTSVLLDRLLNRRVARRGPTMIGGPGDGVDRLGEMVLETSLELRYGEGVEVGGGDRYVVLEGARHRRRVRVRVSTESLIY